VAGLVRELNLLGYDKRLIQENYTFRDLYDPSNRDRTATVAAFGEIPFTPESSCFAIFTSNGEHGKELVLKYRALAAPFALEVGDEKVDFWTVGRTEEAVRNRFSMRESEFASRFQEHANEWSSSSVLRAKNIDADAEPRQRDLFDFGLVPQVDELVFQKLDPLLRESLATAVSTYRKNTGNKPEPRQLFRLAFWLLAAKVYHDHGIAPFNSLVANSGPDVALEAIASYYGEKPQRLLDLETREAVFEKTWTQLDFRHVSIDVLIRIWATTFVTREVRESQGIHATPRSVVRYIVDRLPFDAFENLETLENDDRFIVEPCSGGAAFLIASLQRLRKMWRSHDLAPQEQHKYFQKVLVGFENEAFGIEIGRVCLTLADSDRDHWNLKEKDVFSSRSFLTSLKKARIVLCNPPFQQFSQEQKNLYSPEFLQKPAEILNRVLQNLHPDGIIGFVLPQVILDGRKGYPSMRRALADRYKTIEIMSLPDAAFRPVASKETVLLLAYNPKKTPDGIFICHKKVSTRDWTRFQLSHEPTSEDTAIKTPDEIEHSLAVPELGRLWAYLSHLDPLDKVAAIHRGIEWKLPLLTKDHKETGNREKLVLREERAGFWPGVPPRATTFSFQVPDTRNLDMRRESLWRPNTLLLPWKSPKIILNAKTKSRGIWRMAAFADCEGIVCYQTFTAVWPNDPSLLIVLTAVLNGPVANAFIAMREGKTDNRNATLGKIPIPPFSEKVKREIEILVGQYVDAVASTASDAENANKTADDLLKRIDALVLSAYDLPPRLERELLEKTREERRSVPFTFSDYFPADYRPCFSLLDYLSDEFKASNAKEFKKARHRPSENILRTLRVAAKADEE
jgi:hypothetical protein